MRYGGPVVATQGQHAGGGILAPTRAAGQLVMMTSRAVVAPRAATE